MVEPPIWKKNMGQIGSFWQVGVKIRNVWKHHLENYWMKRRKIQSPHWLQWICLPRKPRNLWFYSKHFLHSTWKMDTWKKVVLHTQHAFKFQFVHQQGAMEVTKERNQRYPRIGLGKTSKSITPYRWKVRPWQTTHLLVVDMFDCLPLVLLMVQKSS